MKDRMKIIHVFITQTHKNTSWKKRSFDKLEDLNKSFRSMDIGFTIFNVIVMIII